LQANAGAHQLSAETHPCAEGGLKMIRELLAALVFLSLAVSVALWFGGGPRLDVQRVEANLAR
jgi:hypothetical protein